MGEEIESYEPVSLKQHRDVLFVQSLLRLTGVVGDDEQRRFSHRPRRLAPGVRLTRGDSQPRRLDGGRRQPPDHAVPASRRRRAGTVQSASPDAGRGRRRQRLAARTRLRSASTDKGRRRLLTRSRRICVFVRMIHYVIRDAEQ